MSINSDLFEQKIQNINVTVKKGNIATENVDCIVVPEFDNCASRGGVGYAIEAEGMSAGLDAYDKATKEKTMLYGDALITESGKNGVKLAHVVTAGADKKDQLGAVQMAVFHTLLSADEQGLKSIAVPELGTGIIGSLTQEQAAQAIFNAVHVFSKGRPNASVKEVSMVVHRGSIEPATKVLTEKSYINFNGDKVGEKEFNAAEWLEQMANGGKPKSDLKDQMKLSAQRRSLQEMSPEEKQSMGMNYTIDEKRKVILYDPQCNNYGKWDYSIDETTKHMAEIAAREKIAVEAAFNGTTFQVSPGMTAEQGVKEWDEAGKRAYEEYKKTPEYKAKQLAAEQKQIKQKAQEAADNILIKNEVLNVEGHKRYWSESVEKNISGMGKSIIEYADRWGKLMQAEMKKQGLDHLTPELVRETDRRADIYGMSGASASFGRNLLIMSWKHGKELAEIEGFEDMNEVAMLRTVESDRAKLFYDTYRSSEPKDFEDAVKKGGQVIATVLQDEALVDHFYHKFSSPKGFSEEDVQKYIPVLKLPDNDWRTLHQACSYALKNISNTKAKIAEGNGKNNPNEK